MRSPVSSAGIMFLAGLFALIWANSPWDSLYYGLRDLELPVSMGGVEISRSIRDWTGEGLMALFFLVVGLGIKKEMLLGKLNTPQKALLPVWAAIGGMALPALIYVALNHGGPASDGWGIPVATDIAFALGVVYVLGSRVPAGLAVFFSAMAIADDLGAVLVIAVFYTKELAAQRLLVCALIVAFMAVLSFMRVKKGLPYVLSAIALWFFMLGSGVHATLAGMAAAMFIPAQGGGSVRGRELRGNAPRAKKDIPTRDAESPLSAMHRRVHPWVVFVVLPLFAFLNVGMPLSFSGIAESVGSRLTLGIMLGFVIGKPLGITAFAFAAVRAGLAELPVGVGWRHIAGAGILGGVGFTMAIFISGISLEAVALREQARVGIVLASALSGMLGAAYFFLLPVLFRNRRER